jgi:hypothetical protein
MAIIDVKVTHDRKQEYLRYSANAKVEYTNIGGRLVKSFCKLVLGERPDMEDISCVFSKI